MAHGRSDGLGAPCSLYRHCGYLLKTLEFGLWATGALLLALFIGAQAWAETERQRGIDTFQRHDAAPHAGDVAVAVLRIGVIELEVPVYDGTDERFLIRGAGLVEGTAAPGGRGNIGIAAHRDGFFRGLKDVAIGDLIELDSPGTTRSYRITGLSVVEPADVHVLADTGEDLLTLVTCYPFYFVGNAPQRFIVRAEAVETHL